MLHLLLNEIVKNLDDRSAFRRVNQSNFPPVPRNRGVGRSRGLALDAKTREGIPVEQDAIRTEYGPDPEPIGLPIILTTKLARQNGIREPIRVQLTHAG